MSWQDRNPAPGPLPGSADQFTREGNGDQPELKASPCPSPTSITPSGKQTPLLPSGKPKSIPDWCLTLFSHELIPWASLHLMDVLDEGWLRALIVV